MSYQLMARLYDEFMMEAPYGKWVEFTEYVINKYNLNAPKMIDLGCGTGEITVQLAKKYPITGVDYSSDMLTIASQKAAETNLTINWIHQDLRELEGLSEFDLAISFCDVMNYITTESELNKVFSNIANLLNEDGIFIFDVHSMKHIEEELIENTFADVTEDNAYIWFCYPGEHKGEMFHELTFFASDRDNYSRFDETHHQRTFSVNVYQNLLKNCGLEILNIYADFSIENDFSEESADRIFIIAQKRTR
ncbi:class I SAM-dependent methyltransferase [Paucisalibacillus sp. EB02]|uniref:class I SAM-dependent DNA methyltransferase n=1 Tax=Paucisalibacillus sp. EB02 TaxID=1347087 RepID=UPI0004B5184C|nr:class I SAM-dependent methyltransferase [Paucisalibacillus sp. EB02]